MIKFCSLYSSSSGNCTYIGNEENGILIDAGVSAKRIETALRGIGVEPSSIKAIFVTHEHSDHIGGVRVFAGRHKVPVYANEGTLTGMDTYGAFDEKVNAFIMPPCGYEIADFFVKPFPIPHDTNDPCGYTINYEGKKIAVVTDLGIVTDRIEEEVTGSDLVLLESNHDVDMLMMGPYPHNLKVRIRSDYGHLCNEDSAAFSKKLYKNGTRKFVLGHLSKENNMPSLAHQTHYNSLIEAGAKDGEFLLTVAGDLNEPIIL